MERNVAAMLRADARTCVVRFPSSEKGYLYVTHLDIAVGDDVVVPANGTLVVVRVIEVHDTVRLEPNDPTKFKWVAAKIDRVAIEESEARNAHIEEVVQLAYKNNLRRSFAAQVLSGLDELASKELQALIAAPVVSDPITPPDA